MERSWCWHPKSRFSDCVQPAILLPLHSRPLRWPRAFLQPPDREGVGTAMSWYASEKLNQALIGLRWSFAMSWCVSGAAWSALIELLVNSVDEDNGIVCRSLAMSVNELIMTASCYKSGASMTTAARYKSRINARLATRVMSRWWQVW